MSSQEAIETPGGVGGSIYRGLSDVLTQDSRRDERGLIDPDEV